MTLSSGASVPAIGLTRHTTTRVLDASRVRGGIKSPESVSNATRTRCFRWRLALVSVTRPCLMSSKTGHALTVDCPSTGTSQSKSARTVPVNPTMTKLLKNARTARKDSYLMRKNTSASVPKTSLTSMQAVLVSGACRRRPGTNKARAARVLSDDISN